MSGWLFVAGIVLFSGSLYALALTGVRSLGAVTPIGGVAFLAAWAVDGVGGMAVVSQTLLDPTRPAMPCVFT